MIAVVGVGCRLPGAPSKRAYWRLLRDGKDAIREVPHDRWRIDDWYSPGEPGKMNSRDGGFIDDVDQFDAAYFKLSPREAAWMDPQQRLVLEVACEALDDAGLLTDQLAGSRTGVFVGSNHCDYAMLIRDEGKVPDPLYSTGTSSCVIANRLSYLFDLRGPSLSIDTACSASLVALHLARQSLLTGESEQAIVAGVSLMLSPELTAVFSELGATSRDGRCKTFDARADGYVRGEGVGVVVLKPLAAAQRDGDRIYAVLLGSAVNQDGTTNGMTAPSGRAQEAVIREALRSGGVSPSQLSYVEAHGTGTLLGDSIEAAALGSVLASAPRSRPCAVGSVKTNIGHLEGASGIASVIKLALSLSHRTLPASLHFETPNPHIEFDKLALAVQAHTAPWTSDGPRIGGISCFGFGGTNAHAVLGEIDAAPAPSIDASERAAIIPISASSARALEALAWSYLDELGPGGTLADASVEAIAHTAAVRRRHLRFRLAIVARSRADFARQLRAFLDGSKSTPRVAFARSVPTPPRIAFVFSGSGGQWTELARELLATEPVYRATLEQLDAALQPHLKRSVIELLACDETVPPALFAHQVSLAALWCSFGINPTAMFGHEVAAACASGALSYDEAARTICARTEATPDTVAASFANSTSLEIGSATGTRDELLRDLAALYVRGYAITWRTLGPATPPVDLPLYPWRHERHWFTEKTEKTTSRATEIGERLTGHPDVAAAACSDVTVRTESRRIAFVVPRQNARLDAIGLRQWLRDSVDSRDLPVSISVVSELPSDLSADGLPDPFADLGAAAPRSSRAPQTATEHLLAKIWSELLRVERIGVDDNFFTLGGNSLLLMRLLEQTRRLGHSLDITTLFATPTVAALAAAMQSAPRDLRVPPRLIADDATAITPAHLPLIALDQASIDRIVETVPGGVANIADIYALTPLQAGMVFHHRLASTGDPYLQLFQMSFPDRSLVERYLTAAQQVIDRHDIFRTAFVFDGVSQPAQVVWRTAPLRVTEGSLDADHHRIDITQAPLMQYAIARDPHSDRWLVTSLLHHLISDRETVEIMHREITALLAGRAAELVPSRPFRDLVANVQRSADTPQDEAFFRGMLGDIDEPTVPFGISDVHGDGHGIAESSHAVPDALNERLRRQARRLGTSLASLCHVAWGQVVARTSGREDAVFGTVLFGRMALGSAADGAMGLYLNTLPIRISLDETDIETTIRRTHVRLAQLLAHEHASLPLAQRCSGVTPPAPLFTSLLNFRHGMADETAAGSGPLATVEWLTVTERTNYPLTLSVNDSGHSLSIRAHVVDTLSADGIADLFLTALADLCNALELQPRRQVRSLEVLSAAERHRLLVEWNATAQESPRDTCLCELVEARVDLTPEAPAVWCDGVEVTYRELDERANQLAHHLLALGVQREQRVAVLLDRSIDLVIALLAISKAGGAYVPLDPSHPRERIAYILADAGATLVITADILARDHDRIASRPRTRVGIESDSRQLAYVMYTSGSTGRPKGVQIEHSALVNLIVAMQRRLDVAADDRLVAVTTPAFDISGLELWLPLCTGARVIVATAEDAMDPTRLARLIEGHAATLLQATPATWRSLVDSGWQGRRELVALCGGEAVPVDLVASLEGKVARLWNVYGPTETTIWSTARVIASYEAPVVIGGPLANTQLYVLGRELMPVPVGVAGELYIGGDGLARGYLGRPDLTAERFLADPFGLPGARMYRTGDLVRWRSDGTIEFLGRVDHQVKVRGFRIELGEVETALRALDGILDAAVAVFDDVLVAYTVQRDEALTSADVQTLLRQTLPAYMVPTAFVILDALPLTPSGKLDRKALPRPDRVSTAYVPPRTPLELQLADVWREVLGIERVGMHDDFFRIGGHSLLAIRLLADIERRIGVRIPLREIFVDSTLGGLAARVSEARANDLVERPALHASATRRARLPAALRGVFKLNKLMTSDHFARHVWSAWIDGPLDLRSLERAVAAMRERHALLRTRFFEVDAREMLEVLDPVDVGRFALIEHADLSSALEPEFDDAKFHQSASFRPLDVGRGEVMGVALSRWSATRHRLSVSLHNIASDAESLTTYVSELCELWRAFAQERDPRLPPASLQYHHLADYLERVHESDVGRTNRSFWRGRLEGLQPLLLPTDSPREQVDARREANDGVVAFPSGSVFRELPNEVLTEIERMAKSQRSSVMSTLVAAMAAYLSERTSQRDLAFITRLSHRYLPGLERALGFLVNPILLRLSTDGAPTFPELVARTHAVVTDAFDHGECDLFELAPYSAFRFCLVYMRATSSDGEMPQLPHGNVATRAPHPGASGGSQIGYDLLLWVNHLDDRAQLYLAYNLELFRDATATEFLDGYVEHITAACTRTP